MKKKNESMTVIPLSKLKLACVYGGIFAKQGSDGNVGDGNRAGSPNDKEVCECVCAICPQVI